MALKLSTTIVFCFIVFLILANHIVSPRQLIGDGGRRGRLLGGVVSPTSGIPSPARPFP
ncbi:hypothetical protein I3843_11G040600 [Carya illinoinensis]|uniref:Uncharacterized protein n=1 Tax=Carya illinoinensis TaxID=32201 RepID=A0A8T1NTE0_CARIL|nr:hypothetical protein CIPAW_11G040700 [Carya illinoinensis]KAG7954837.1 hypothetical protein I3843_11G040600 [Carya illinoinensis]